MPPLWLHMFAVFSLIVAVICAAVIAYDELRDPQHMWIMNAVWPVVALFGSVVALWAYFAYGRLSTRSRMQPALEKGETPPARKETPFYMMVAKGAAHCGSGCTIGDVIAEWTVFFIPAVAVWFGWGSVFSEKIFAVWVLDFLLAFVIGIAFQYFTIKPMRNLSVRDGIVQALKADTLSLTAWQVGMYGFMAIAHFWIFAHMLNLKLEVDSAEFWFMMQIAMWFGFATAYPVNWWLVRSGIKEKM